LGFSNKNKSNIIVTELAKNSTVQNNDTDLIIEKGSNYLCFMCGPCQCDEILY
jgi:hypothetical protein